jgi:hypothetical protein
VLAQPSPFETTRPALGAAGFQKEGGATRNVECLSLWKSSRTKVLNVNVLEPAEVRSLSTRATPASDRLAERRKSPNRESNQNTQNGWPHVVQRDRTR